MICYEYNVDYDCLALFRLLSSFLTYLPKDMFTGACEYGNCMIRNKIIETTPPFS